MTREAGPVVRAAGGVLWRPGAQGLEVALVHRPRYDDWSLPKGKLEPGEHPLAGALREVQEETGVRAVPGRSLGTSAYDVLQDGRWLPKTVRWWAMRAGDGAFAPSHEVDELRWLPPEDAEDLLTAGRDIAPLRLLVAAGTGTSTVLVVRHARAGERASWEGDDLDRPLDERGHAQADALADLVAAYEPARVLSAPALRCLDTVRPAAALLHAEVEVEPLLGEPDGAERPDDVVALVRGLLGQPGCTVVCSHGSVVPGLVRALARGSGVRVGKAHSRKGSMWALSACEGSLVDAVHVPPRA